MKERPQRNRVAVIRSEGEVEVNRGSDLFVDTNTLKLLRDRLGRQDGSEGERECG